MKKLKLSLSDMKGVELLTREQLKRVRGGSGDGSDSWHCSSGPCTLSIQGSDGQWVTRNGTCNEHVSGMIVDSCYCDAGLGSVPLSSNGGTSRCTEDGPWWS